MYGFIKAVIYFSVKDVHTALDNINKRNDEHKVDVSKMIEDNKHILHNFVNIQRDSENRIYDRIEKNHSETLTRMEVIAQQNKDFRITYEQEIGNIRLQMARDYSTKDDFSNLSNSVATEFNRLPCKGCNRGQKT